MSEICDAEIYRLLQRVEEEMIARKTHTKMQSYNYEYCLGAEKERPVSVKTLILHVCLKYGCYAHLKDTGIIISCCCRQMES